MFESNKKRRQVLEKELLLKVTRNGKEGERKIRFQRQKQEQEEMLREGAMVRYYSQNIEIEIQCLYLLGIAIHVAY